MALETKLYQKLSQQLVMTPQLRQAIKILQVSRAELESLIQEELSENPVLEESGEVPDVDNPSRTDESADNQPGNTEEWIDPREETDRTSEIEPNVDKLADIDWREYLNNYSNDWQGASQTAADFDDDKPTWEARASPATSLAEHLVWQLRLSGMTPVEESIVAHLIGNLDKDGYLHVDIEEVAFRCGVEFDLVEVALRRLQSLEPPGVGARDLKECLLLQIDADDNRDELAAPIVRDHIELLEARRFDKIARELDVPVPEVVAAAAYIASLEPKPGRDFDAGEVRYIVPDVYVHKFGDELQITLNDDGLPRLRVSNYYRQVLGGEGGGSGDAKRYIQEKMRSAAWLIKSIHQRQRTLTLVAQSIVRFQREFFDHGVTHLKPLVLKDVANDIGMHESTVSRATSNKYVHTPQGTFELKYFFTSSLQGADGEDVSAESVKERIRAIIEAEDPKRPLSDQEIAKMLAGESVGIARRTVAKYRELMGLLPSSKRRRAL